MDKLWNRVNKIKASKEIKMYLFLMALMVFWGFVGFAVWQIVRLFVLDHIIWAICFVGYPACFIGFISGIFYLWRH